MDASNLFSKTINGRVFNFQTLEFGNETGYHIDVKDDEGTRWEFRMFNTDEKKARIEGEKLPSWIFDLESELRKAIDEHE